MSRDNAKIKGVFVPYKDMTDDHIQHWKDSTTKEYGAPDQYGKSKTVEFEEVVEEHGSRYISFWAE